jgi:hypothetical protein
MYRTGVAQHDRASKEHLATLFGVEDLGPFMRRKIDALARVAYTPKLAHFHPRKAPLQVLEPRHSSMMDGGSMELVHTQECHYVVGLSRGINQLDERIRRVAMVTKRSKPSPRSLFRHHDTWTVR